MPVPDLYLVEGVDRHGDTVSFRTYESDTAEHWADGINRRGGKVIVKRLVYHPSKAAFVDPENPHGEQHGDAEGQ